MRSLPLAEDACKKTLPRETIGEPLPTPGSGTFHRTFSLSVQVTGTSLSWLTPVPLGPRKRGQSDAAAAPQAARITPRHNAARASRLRLMAGKLSQNQEALAAGTLPGEALRATAR